MMIGVTGHQRLPSDVLPFITARIERIVHSAAGQLTGISSLAAGADQLFAEIVLKAGGKLHIIVPCEDYESTFENENSLVRFRTLLANAENVETLAHKHPSEEAFLDAGRRVADLSQLLVAVWDGDEAKGKGGTGDIVRYARRRNGEVIVIWPEGTMR